MYVNGGDQVVPYLLVTCGPWWVLHCDAPTERRLWGEGTLSRAAGALSSLPALP